MKKIVLIMTALLMTMVVRAENAPRTLEPYYGNVVVGPLMQTQWGQSEPYNNLCPIVDEAQGHTLTGCANTALTQIMAYWKHPQQGFGSFSYYWNPTKESPRFYHGDGFSQHTYDWNNMLNVYNEGEYTDAQAKAVAQLMSDVGIVNQTGYGYYMQLFLGGSEVTLGSGAVVNTQLFPKFFNYDADSIQEVLLKIDTFYFDTEKMLEMMAFEERIKADLRKNRPVFLVVTSLNHAVVIDGYSDKNYYHVNFGWGGKSDGWYQLLAIDPDHADPDFRVKVRYNEFLAITGICPAKNTRIDNAYWRFNGEEATLICMDAAGAVEVPSTVTDNDNHTYTVTAVSSIAFSYNDSVTSITLPATVTRIGIGAFAECAHLESVNIQGAVTKLPKRAFMNCPELTTVTLTKGMTTIDKHAFERCEKLTNLTLPEGLTTIGDSAFLGCYELTLTCESSLTHIGAYAFYYCKKLDYLWLAQATYIGSWALSDCPLTSVTLDRIETIGEYPFGRHETTLTDFTLGAHAAIMELPTLPSSLTRIRVTAGNKYFTSMDNMIFTKDMLTLVYCSSQCYDKEGRQYMARTELEIPEGVTRIGREAVHSVSYPSWSESLTIPATVTEIDTLAFAGAFYQKVYNYAATPQALKGKVFGGAGTVYVPEGCRDAYMAAEVWKDMNIYDDLPAPNYDSDEYYVLNQSDDEILVNGVRIQNQNAVGDVWAYEILFKSKPVLRYEKVMNWDSTIVVNNVILTADCDLEMVLNWNWHYPEEQPANLIAAEMKTLEFFYDDSVEAIETAKTDNITVRFVVHESTIDISGLNEGERIELFTLDGKSILATEASALGTVQVTVPGGGVYILQTSHASFKILTK